MKRRKKSISEWQKYNPFIKPDWRFERVLQLIENLPYVERCSTRDDKYVVKYKKFLLKYKSCKNEYQKQKIFESYPVIYLAHQIYENSEKEPEVYLIIQARLLAGQNFEAIANNLHTKPAVIEWYSKIFFDVRDRLDNKDWITKHVLKPSIDKYFSNVDSKKKNYGLAFLDGTLKILCYFGGPAVADLVINALPSRKTITNEEQLDEWIDNTWTLTVKRRSLQAALSCSINNFNVMSLLGIHDAILGMKKNYEHKSLLSKMLGNEDGENNNLQGNYNLPQSFEEHIKSVLEDIQIGIFEKPVGGGEDKENYLQVNAFEWKDEEKLLGNNDDTEKLKSLPPPRNMKPDEILDKIKGEIV